MRATAEMALRHNVRLHTHLAETRDEEAYCLRQFGCRPLDLLSDAGWSFGTQSGPAWVVPTDSPRN